jgi:hypothetical protein
MGALDSFFSYLRVPALAFSGIAALLSGALYFKQKYGFLAKHRVDTNRTQ